MFRKIRSSGSGGIGFWNIFGLMYIFTSDTVEPFGKLEFLAYAGRTIKLLAVVVTRKGAPVSDPSI